MAIVHVTRAELRSRRPAGGGRHTRKRKGAGKQFDWADDLAAQVALIGLPAPARDQFLLLPRKFKTDLCWPDRRLFAECDGAEWATGQHGRGQGMKDDCVKWNLLTLAGWRGLRFTGSQVKNGYAVTTIERALAGPGVADQANR